MKFAGLPSTTLVSAGGKSMIGCTVTQRSQLSLTSECQTYLSSKKTILAVNIISKNVSLKMCNRSLLLSFAIISLYKNTFICIYVHVTLIKKQAKTKTKLNRT